jgi:hypothetical protein
MNKTNNDSDKKTKQKDPCYKCRELGHWISECPSEDFVMPPVPGSSHPHIPREHLPLEMWNPETPTEEPPKKRRKLSRTKVGKNSKKKNFSPQDCVYSPPDCVYSFDFAHSLGLLCLFCLFCSICLCFNKMPK